MKRAMSLLAATAAAFALALPAAAQEGTLKKIKDSGSITIGHRDASIPLSYLDDKGKVIMVAGQTGALMYVVLEGRVAISIRGAVVQYVTPGGVFGEMALVDQSPRSANAAAETDCVLLGINRQVFLNLIKSNPTFGASLLAAVAERVRNTAAGLN